MRRSLPQHGFAAGRTALFPAGNTALVFDTCITGGTNAFSALSHGMLFLHDTTSLHQNFLSVNQRLRDSAACGCENAPEGLSTHLHLRRGIGVIQSLRVCQAQRLHFIKREDELYELPRRYSGRFEAPHLGLEADGAAVMRSSSALLHVTIIGICS